MNCLEQTLHYIGRLRRRRQVFFCIQLQFYFRIFLILNRVVAAVAFFLPSDKKRASCVH